MLLSALLVQVREEILEKGLDRTSADKLETFVAMNGSPFEMLASLRAKPEIMAHKSARSTLSQLQTLFEYLAAYDVLQYGAHRFLARGSDGFIHLFVVQIRVLRSEPCSRIRTTIRAPYLKPF